MERDEKIVAGVRRKDERAFGLLVEDYGPLIRAIVRCHLSATMYTEECENDILLSLWQNMGSYDPKKNSLKNWIGAVSKYKCVDYLRRHYREACTVPLSEGLSAEEPEDLRELVEELLEALKPDDRMLFREHYLEGRSVTEIARATRKNPDLLYNRLSLGRKRLRNMFGKEQSL